MKQVKYIILAILIAKIQSQQCDIGCQACVTLEDNQSSCDKCFSDYFLQNGACIYQNCQSNLYYQIGNNDDKSFQGSCQSICDPLFFSDQLTNICQKQVQCSSNFSTQPNFLNSGIPVDFFIYQISYYVALQQGYLTIYNKSRLDFVKNLSYQSDDLSIQNLGDLIVVLKKDFSIYVWDIINENRQSIDKNSIIQINQQVQFTLFLDQVFMGNETNLVIQQINYQTQDNYLNQSQPILFSFENKGNILQVLQGSNSSIYFTIFTNGVFEIDLAKQTISILILQQSIQKAKLLMSSNNLNFQHLLILTSQNLIDYNYISKQSIIISNQITIISDFDVGNFSGINNQLILLSNQKNLLIYNFDSNQSYQQPQQTIYLNFQSQNLKKIQKYQNPYQEKGNESETAYEVVFFSLNSIQIIRQSSVQQQLLQQDVIENFNLPFPTPSSQYFDAIKIFNSEQDTILNRYSIDEIVYFDIQSKFYIFDGNLQNSYVLQINLLKSLASVKRVINDASVYFLAGFQSVKGNNSILLVSKTLSYSLLISTSTYFPVIEEPKRIINGYGSVFYSIKRIFLLNQSTLLKEFQVDIKRNITYVAGHDHISIGQASASIYKMIGSPLNFQSYFGSQAGLIYTGRCQQNRYQVLPTNNILSQTNTNDQILEIIQSAQLGMYFVRTMYKITSFNMFTNQFIELITPQISSDAPFSSFQLTQNNQSLVCWNQNQLLLVVYGKNSKKYYYKGMNQINGWIFNSPSNNFYIYGSSFQVLNSELQVLLTVPDSYKNKKFLLCKDTQQVLICGLSVDQFVLINRTAGQFSFLNVQVNGFTSQYLISVDEQYQNIFLYNQQIQIYNFNGVYRVGYKFNTQFISFSLAATRLIFQSTSSIYFLDRISLNLQKNYIQSPSGMLIINYIYIDFLQQIVLYANLSTFSQIYIYDSISLQNTSKINASSFAQNLVGNVVNMFFDFSTAEIFFLDSYGNIYAYNLFSDQQVQSNFKISEIFDRNEQLVSFSFDNITNNLIVYSTNNIYQIDYSLIGYFYEAQLNEPSKLFTTIPINNQTQTLEFLFFNNDNVMFRYQKYSLNFESIIQGSQIVDCMYYFSTDTLIIAQKDQIIFYQNYQNSKDNNQMPQVKILKQIQFFKFIQYNVYLTYDKKIIYCNILTGEVINISQLETSVIITQNISSNDLNSVFIGLSNGQVLQINLKDFTQSYYSIQNNNSINTSIISMILDEAYEATKTAYFTTNGGILLIVDVINKKLIQQQNLSLLVKEDESIILVDFVLDKIYSRYIFTFSGQKKAYVWNFSSNSQEQYLALTKDQGNKIKLYQNYLITFSTFQLIIYSVSDQLSLLTVIKRNFITDQITSYELINNNILIIFFISKFEVFQLKNSSNNLIFQQQYNYPRYLASIYNQADNILKIFGVHQSGVFENNLSISLYESNNLSECTIALDDDDISQLNQKISNVSPKQNLVYTTQGSSTQNQQTWNNLIYLQVTNEQFQNVNNYIYQNKLINSQYIFYPKSNDNNLTLNNNTFYYSQQPILRLVNYNFVLEESQEQSLVNFNQNVQTIIWQNISITNQCIQNIQINFCNVEKIIIQSMNISNLFICNNTKYENQQPYLLSFTNVSQIYIYDLEISMLMLKDNHILTLLNFDNVDYILIQGVKITNNKQVNSFFEFVQINNITISNMNIINNSNQQQQNAANRRDLQQQLQIETFYTRKNSNITSKIIRYILKKIMPKKYYDYYVISFQTPYKTYIYWKLVRQNVQKIIQFKASQNMSIHTSKLISQNNSQRTEIYETTKTTLLKNFKSNLRPNQKDSILSHSRKKSSSNFKLLKIKFNNDEDNQYFKNDCILESEQNQQLEESDPKKVRNYNFSPKSSMINSKFYFDNSNQTSILNN
ncbi:hypothetical protein ABPG73_007990 [Tetrahymena malaccensis]